MNAEVAKFTQRRREEGIEGEEKMKIAGGAPGFLMYQKTRRWQGPPAGHPALAIG